MHHLTLPPLQVVLDQHQRPSAATRRAWMRMPDTPGRDTTDQEREALSRRAQQDLLGLGREIEQDPTRCGFVRGGRVMLNVEMYAHTRWLRHEAARRVARDGCCGRWRDAARLGFVCPAGQGMCRSARAAAAIERFTVGLEQYLGEHDG